MHLAMQSLPYSPTEADIDVDSTTDLFEDLILGDLATIVSELVVF